MGAATFAVIAAALDCHVREAARRGWALPTLCYGDDAAAAAAAARRGGASGDGGSAGGGGSRIAGRAAAAAAPALEVEGMWPYWLDGHAAATVHNSFAMEVRCAVPAALRCAC